MCTPVASTKPCGQQQLPATLCSSPGPSDVPRKSWYLATLSRNQTTIVKSIIVVFALLAPSAAVLWGNTGALAGFAATALTVVAVMKLCSFMHFHDSLRCGPTACLDSLCAASAWCCAAF